MAGAKKALKAREWAAASSLPPGNEVTSSSVAAFPAIAAALACGAVARLGFLAGASVPAAAFAHRLPSGDPVADVLYPASTEAAGAPYPVWH